MPHVGGEHTAQPGWPLSGSGSDWRCLAAFSLSRRVLARAFDKAPFIKKQSHRKPSDGFGATTMSNRNCSQSHPLLCPESLKAVSNNS